MVYPIIKRILFPAVRLWIKEINHINNIPGQGSFILAANHASYLDHLIMGGLVIPRLNKKLHFLAKKEHFDNFLKKAWHTYGGAIPVDRQKGGKKALKIALKILNEGEIIGIHPEGTRSLTGKLHEAKTGVARLALSAKVPVVPIGLTGTFEILPKGKYVPRFKRAIVNIGKPMYFPEYYNKKINKRILRDVTTRIMKEIAKLSSQKYNFK